MIIIRINEIFFSKEKTKNSKQKMQKKNRLFNIIFVVGAEFLVSFSL